MTDATLYTYENSDELAEDVRTLLEASAINYSEEHVEEVGLPELRIETEESFELYRGLAEIKENLSDIEPDELAKKPK